MLARGDAGERPALQPRLLTGCEQGSLWREKRCEQRFRGVRTGKYGFQTMEFTVVINAQK